MSTRKGRIIKLDALLDEAIIRAKKIILDHGGRIWAESQLGIGTSIFFTLKQVKY